MCPIYSQHVFRYVHSWYSLYYHILIHGDNVPYNCLVYKFTFQGLAISYVDGVPRRTLNQIYPEDGDISGY
jgi:hypothetical protein